MDVDAAAQTFLELDRIAVAGVSRSGRSPANAIATRLRGAGRTVFALNPTGEVVDGQPTYPSIRAVPAAVQGVVVVTRPSIARQVVADAAANGVRWIWFHQGFGPVSFDEETLRLAREAGMQVISVGCPMMYCDPDGFHRCARSVFRWFGRIPRDIDVGGVSGAPPDARA